MDSACTGQSAVSRPINTAFSPAIYKTRFTPSHRSTTSYFLSLITSPRPHRLSPMSLQRITISLPPSTDVFANGASVRLLYRTIILWTIYYHRNKHRFGYPPPPKTIFRGESWEPVHIPPPPPFEMQKWEKLFDAQLVELEKALPKQPQVLRWPYLPRDLPPPTGTRKRSRDAVEEEGGTILGNLFGSLFSSRSRKRARRH
ncbi:hypothetical protein BDN72DRAFT_536673 [Pluteus cervinus]|uniref:Uncharacterized protein n=1 Tax=Pluteus cervinus TaxID=181527 RepID=A0ACD3A3W4_9AGAR|nr:hypothetical protein BDN72DRAFT_536673 [Pluteus cervinus]